jgi:anaphase-promoting complex subunit 3
VDDAVRAFNAALDLRPGASDVATIRAAIDKIHLPDEDLEEEL